MTRICHLLFLVAIFMTVVACNGGGGGGDAPSSQNPPAQTPPNTNDSADPPGNGGDEELNEDPQDEEPEEPAAPVDPMTEIKFSVERMLGTINWFDRLNDSQVLEVPTMPGVADQIAMELPHRPDDLEGVLPYSVYLPTPENETVTVIFWQDGNRDGQYNPEPHPMPDAVTFISQGALGVNASVGVANQLVDGHPMTIAAINGYDGQAIEGARVVPTEDFQVSAIIMRRELEDGRIRFGDDDLRPSATRNITLRVKNFQYEWDLLDTKVRVDLKAGDGYGVEASINWLVNTVEGARLKDILYVDADHDGLITPEEAVAEENLDFESADTDDSGDIDKFEYSAAKEAYYMANGGLRESFETVSTLEFGIINGEVMLKTGSAAYIREQNGETVRVQVSVDPDPAFLKLEVDADEDGLFETTERVPQSEIHFVLP